MRDMSLGHIDTLTFCIKTIRMSWRLVGDWLYFHAGTWIISCSCHAWYVLGHSATLTFSINPPPPPPRMLWRLGGKTDYNSPGHNYFLSMTCGICLWDISTYLHYVSTPPRMLGRLDWDWLYFQVPGTWIISCSYHAWYVPGTYRNIYILYQHPTHPYVMAPGGRLIIFPCPRDMN